MKEVPFLPKRVLLEQQQHEKKEEEEEEENGCRVSTDRRRQINRRLLFRSFFFVLFHLRSSSFFSFFFWIRRPLFMLPTSSLPLLPFLLLLLLFFKGASHLGRHFYFSLQKTKKILKKNEDMKWNYSLNSTRAAVRFPFDERPPPQLTSWLVGQSPRRFRLYRRLLKSGRSNQFEFELERHRVCPHQNDLEISNRFQNNKLPLINQKISWPITASLSVIPKIA